MTGNATLIFCGSCRKPVSHQTSKEAIYELERVRYLVELCPLCLDEEMKRHGVERGVSGFRKRSAVVFKVASLDDVPGTSPI